MLLGPGHPVPFLFSLTLPNHLNPTALPSRSQITPGSHLLIPLQSFLCSQVTLHSPPADLTGSRGSHLVSLATILSRHHAQCPCTGREGPRVLTRMKGRANLQTTHGCARNRVIRPVPCSEHSIRTLPAAWASVLPNWAPIFPAICLTRFPPSVPLTKGYWDKSCYLPSLCLAFELFCPVSESRRPLEVALIPWQPGSANPHLSLEMPQG